MASIKLSRDTTGRIKIQFSEYDAALVNKVKGIPGRQWHSDVKAWSIPADQLSIQQLAGFFAPVRVEIAPNLSPTISEVTRRDILDYLIVLRPPYHGRLDIVQFLSRILDLSNLPSTDSRFSSATGDIWQHMVNNSDWDHEYLLYSYLDFLHCEAPKFLELLEQCVHPIVRTDLAETKEIVSQLNDMLRAESYQLRVERYISDKPVFRARILYAGDKAVNPETYDVVLSYAGEESTYVEAVANYLDTMGIKVFFAPYKEATMWGKDLTEYLDHIYRGDAKFCVMFISQNYARKAWPNHERRSALAKAVSAKQEYVLPARFDDTEVPGLQPSVVYIDLRVKTPEQVGKLIAEKLRMMKD